MRKLFSFLFICLVVTAYARQITADEAASIATEFLNSSSSVQKSGKRANVRRAQTKDAPQSVEENQPYYIFNADNDKGFVIISGDDRAKKILGYSDKGKFDMSNMPPQLSAMLNQYAEQISNLNGNTPDSSWSTPSRATSDNEDGVLLETANWGQGYPYNAQCPVIDGVQCPTGCVATAMAIVMKYHNWPEQGSRQQLYFDEMTGSQFSIDFSSLNLNWDDMPLSSDESNSIQSDFNGVSELMRILGIAIGTIYQPMESSTTVDLVSPVFQRYFDYSDEIHFEYRKDFTDNEWRNLIISDLRESRPILYTGVGTGGHAFVLDGYNGEDMFHINWGWEGRSNGYFDIGSLIPEDYNFNNCQNAILGIRPRSLDDLNIWSDCTVSENSYNGNKFLVSTTDIGAGVPFDVSTPEIILPSGCKYDYGIALVDNDLNIKEIVSSMQTETICGGCIQEVEGSFRECTIKNSSVKEGDCLYLATHIDGDKKWKLVKPRTKIPSYGECDNLQSELCKVFWNIDSRLYVGIFMGNYLDSEKKFDNENFDEIPTEFLKGLCVYIGLTGTDTDMDNYSALRVNGDLYSMQTESENPGVFFRFTDSEYIIDALAHYGNDDRDIDIDCPEAGSLHNLINSQIDFHYADISVQGNIFSHELNYFRHNLMFAHSIDLSKCNIIPSSDENSNMVPHYCFYDLGRLKNLSLPQGLTTIGEGAVCNSPLEYLTLPSSIEKISNIAFWINPDLSPSLKAICCQASIPPVISETTFENNAANAILYVKKGSLDAYKSSPYWNAFKEIKEGYVTCLQFDKTDYEGKAGDAFTISTQIVPADAPNTLLVWTSENEDIAVVDDNGRVTMLTPGETKITASTTDGTNIRTSCAVVVNPVLAESIAIDPTIWSGEEGSTFHISAVVLPENTTDKTLEWSSSDTTVATVDTNGLVSVVKEGQCTISVETTDGSNLTAECQLDILSGINGVFADENITVDVYNSQGALLKKNCDKKDLEQLVPGVYIVRDSTKTIKVLIK